MVIRRGRPPFSAPRSEPRQHRLLAALATIAGLVALALAFVFVTR